MTLLGSERSASGSRLALVCLTAFLLLMVAGFLGLDRVVAVQASAVEPLNRYVDFLELITLKDRSEFLFPGLLMLLAGAAWLVRRGYKARALCFVGLVQLLSYLLADLAKPLVGRLRPFEVRSAQLADTWLAGGNSFPSGHVAFFAGMIVPVIVLVPRAWPLLIVPLLVAAQRITAGDHYLSDTAAGFVLAAVCTLILVPLLRVGPGMSGPLTTSPAAISES